MAAVTRNKADDTEALWRIHALAPMMMIKEIAKKNNHTDETSVVLVSSQAMHEGAAGHSAYASAKGAVEGYIRPAAAELAEKGMRINAVCPGIVNTEMSGGWMDKLDDKALDRIKTGYPLGFLEPEDVAKLIGFLISDLSGKITGQVITIDGGHEVRKV